MITQILGDVNMCLKFEDDIKSNKRLIYPYGTARQQYIYTGNGKWFSIL